MPGRRRQSHSLERVLGTPALFATAYGNVGSSIYYALGVTAAIALGLTPLVFVISGLIFACTAATYAEGTVLFPEAGGSSSFARHAFNELVSFGAAWAQMLNYIITVAISAFFVPHYLSIFWAPLKTNPWDIIGGIIVVVVLVGINIVGVKEAAALNVGLAVIDFATQLLLVGLGFALVFSPHVLKENIHWGIAPTWSNFALAIPVAMIAYTGIETVSNLAEEARDPRRTIPGSIRLVAIAVFAIYFTLPLVALSALPVYKDASGAYVTKLGLPPPQGFENDPVLGLVENLGLHGVLLSAAKVYVGVLAATILFIATNAGVIGASRITYSMSSHRQLPELFRRLHPKFKTPWLALLVFAGFFSILFMLPGNVDFIGRMYAFGAMLSFTIAHASVIQLRRKPPPVEDPYRVRPNFTLRGVSWPIFAIVGGIGTGLAFLVVVSRTRPPVTPASAGSRPGSSSTTSTGAGSASRCGRRYRAAPVRAGGRARVPDDPRSDRLRARVARVDRHRRAPRGRARCHDRRAARDRRSARPPARGADGRRGGRGRPAARRRPCRGVGLRRPHDRPHRACPSGGPGDRRGGRAPPGRDRRPRRSPRPPQGDLRQDRRLRPQERPVPCDGRGGQESGVSRTLSPSVAVPDPASAESRPLRAGTSTPAVTLPSCFRHTLWQ